MYAQRNNSSTFILYLGSFVKRHVNCADMYEILHGSTTLPSAFHIEFDQD
jgi:hypothetical protein